MRAAREFRITRFRTAARWGFAVLLTLVVCLVIFRGRARTLISPSGQWKISGKFIPHGVYPTTKLESSVKPGELKDMIFWGSWAGDDRNTGELVSPVFRAPSILELYVSGYPSKPRNGIFLEREDTHARQQLLLSTNLEPGERWVKLDWMLPSSLSGKNIHLVAVDNETAPGGWLGVSTPRAAGLISVGTRHLSVILIYLLTLFLFLLPGFAISLAIAARREVCPVSVVKLIILSSAALGYLAFWIYFGNRLLGKILSFGSVAIAALVLAIILIRHRRMRNLCREIATPFVYVSTVGVCYLCFLFLFGLFPSGASVPGLRFFKELRPGDNLVPLVFADKILTRAPIEPFCCGDWLSSDRPPLQTGIFLLQRTLKLSRDIGLQYECLGTALQCLWICGVWCLLKTVRAREYPMRQVLGFLIFSGFLFYNSVYVWPKLLAATFVLFCVSIVLRLINENRPITSFDTAIGAASFSLAMMSHPGAVFSFPALLLLLLPKRRLLPLRQCVLGIALVAIFVAPWIAYQKFYDPPGNRLLKMHLAGAFDIDPRSTLQALKDSYTKWDLGTYVRFKLENLRTLIGPKPMNTAILTSAHFIAEHRPDRQFAEQSRVIQREYIWNAVGILNVGWLGLVVLLFRKNRDTCYRYFGLIAASAVLDLVLWSIVMFGPAQTFTTHSSYADIILLSVGLCGFVLALPWIIVLLLFILQIVHFFGIWVFAAPPTMSIQTTTGITPMMELPLLIVGAACAVGLALHFGKSYFQPDGHFFRRQKHNLNTRVN
ncbi:MAG: hypothetical protein JOY62_18110 [Acidobacteriaceae bacterium]|nr:hypothetical protein [Acidobacteriaceae bacterium]MBV9781882.1 hypothetical protein [Acidobacteriaceae bacterium]